MLMDLYHTFFHKYYDLKMPSLLALIAKKYIKNLKNR